MNTLDTKINTLFELKKNLDQLKADIDTLQKDIIDTMTTEKVSSVTTESGIVAKTFTKDTFKYNDELKMIKYLSENGFNQFLETSINKTALNAELKKNVSLTESLQGDYTKTTTTMLKLTK